VFPPIVDVLIRQGAFLHTYLRSAHAGSVLLLAAALVLPFAQGARWLGSVARSARAGVILTAHGPHAALEIAREGHRPTIKSGRARVGLEWVSGLPTRRGAPEADPEQTSSMPAPSVASPALRRDLERGPPFFL
jgi:hypothetical protein